MSEEASRLLQAAATASREPTAEERNFETLLRNTRRNFRRPEEATTPRRGRKRKRSIKKKVVLLKLAHAEFYPCNAELSFLKQRGLGEPENPLEIFRDLSLVEITDNIITLFHSSIQCLLRMCGFKICKVEKSKKITILNNITDGTMLETEIGQGKIVLLPKTDFPDDLPILVQNGTSQMMGSPVSVSPSTSNLNRRHPNDVHSNSPQPSTSRSAPIFLRPRVLRLENTTVEISDEDDTDKDLSIVEEIVQEGEIMLPSLPEDARTTVVNISRSNCFNELMKIYDSNEIVDTKLNVQFIDELGVDGGGLTKEVFNIFFEQCENLYFHGEDCLIPHLPLNKRHEIDNFIKIGRILQNMLVLTSTIPTKLSKITLMLISKPTCEIKSDMLWLEILNYVNPYLRKILKKGKKNFESLTSKEVDILQEFYQACKYYSRASSGTFEEQISTIANEILVETPRRLIEKIREGVCPDKYSNFWNMCDFNILMDMQNPTPTKVVNCLITDSDLENDESDVYHYFTMYINCLDNEKLRKLLFLITGSFLMPDSITVKFNDLVGLGQRPIFSTCTDTITLPKTYADYNELKNDLNMCLNCDEVKEYTSY